MNGRLRIGIAPGLRGLRFQSSHTDVRRERT